jgi:hypothetical protein
MRYFAYIFLLLFFPSCSNHYFLMRVRTDNVIREDLDTGALKSFVKNNFSDGHLTVVISQRRFDMSTANTTGSFDLVQTDKNLKQTYKVLQLHNQIISIAKAVEKRDRWQTIEYSTFSIGGILDHKTISKQIYQTPKHVRQQDTVIARTVIKRYAFDVQGNLETLQDYDHLFKFKLPNLVRLYKHQLKENIKSVNQLWYNTKESQNHKDSLLQFNYQIEHPYYLVTSSVGLERRQIGRIIDGNSGQILSSGMIEFNISM